jgi:hypothetical protein
MKLSATGRSYEWFYLVIFMKLKFIINFKINNCVKMDSTNNKVVKKKRKLKRAVRRKKGK